MQPQREKKGYGIGGNLTWAGMLGVLAIWLGIPLAFWGVMYLLTT